jgi:hypothetical protein
MDARNSVNTKRDKNKKTTSRTIIVQLLENTGKEKTVKAVRKKGHIVNGETM